MTGILLGVEVNIHDTLNELEVNDCGILFGVEVQVNIHDVFSEHEVNLFSNEY